MSKRVLLTGAGGFVGSHVLRHILRTTTYTVVCPVTMRHFGDTSRIRDILSDPENAGRVEIFVHDLSVPFSTVEIDEIGEINYILNIASNSGVEESIANPSDFVRNNIELMVNLIDYARAVKPEVFLHMGTDEEYGAAPNGYEHKEWEAIIPSNPYAASKAAQSSLAIAAWRTYGVPLILTRTMNLIGPGQSGQKLVPTVIRKVLAGETVPIYSSPEGVPGSRHWIDAREFGDAWLHLLTNTEPEMYPEYDRPSLWHIVGNEYSNLEVAQTLANLLGKPLKYDLVSFHSSRPGHDLRYALDGTKLAEAGWSPKLTLEETLRDTVEWYMNNPSWLLGR